jgi:sugar phosphate isomerase/epimerase
VKSVAWHPTEERRDDDSVVWRENWETLRDGQVDFDEYFGTLTEVGYNGWVTLEDFSTTVPLAQRTADNLAFVRAVEARTAAHRATPEGADAVDR